MLPYLDMVIDAIHANVRNIPATARGVMGYATGEGVQWTPEDWDRFPYAGKIRLDQSSALSAFAEGNADGADIESGAGTMGAFLTGAARRRAAGHDSTLYVSADSLPIVRGDVDSHGLTASVMYAVANWSLTLDQAISLIGTNNIVLVQWASPDSNPRTLVPGSTLTLAEAGCDLSVKSRGWFGSAYPAFGAYAEAST